MRANRTGAFVRLPWLLVLASLIACLPSAARGLEALIADVFLNRENKGQLFLQRADDGDFLVKAADLLAMGLKTGKAPVREVDGEAHVSLRSLPGVTFVFNEETLSLAITADPALLPERTIDLAPRRQPNVSYPKDSSAFFNYRLGYTGGAAPLRGHDAAGEVGARSGDFLFLSDFSYVKTPVDSSLVRLSTSVTRDNRETLQRTVFGDFLASSGELGTSINLGGISFSKVYRIDPYLIRHPLAGFSGMVSLPSEAEVSLDGMPIRREKLAPGAFDLRNLSYYGGAREITVVIRDAFGREQRLSYPFYFTDDLLERGLHEYSYNLGFLREGFGTESFRYKEPAFSAFHRYGVRDDTTVGVRGEGWTKGVNGGPEVFLLIGNAGILAASLSGSVSRDGAGAAGLVRHEYQDRSWSSRVFLRGSTREYALAGEETRGNRAIREAGASLGYGTPEVGSISAEYAVATMREGSDRRTGSLSYSRNLAARTRLSASLRRVDEERSENIVFVGLTHYPWRDMSVSASHEKRGETDATIVQAQKNPPVGEGYGGRVSLERRDAPEGSRTVVNPFLQWNSRYAAFTGEYRKSFGGGGTDDMQRLTVSGGIVAVGNTFGATRPVTDSFGLVRVGGLKGVRVYQNGQEVGRTDSRGQVLVPDLNSYYENQVSVSDKDVPIEYSLPEIVRYVSPPLRSGSVIPFEARRIQAITGFLKEKTGGEPRPIEYYEAAMKVGDREILFQTGKRGEFYLENVSPGSHEARIEREGKPCTFRMTIPESDEMIIDIGEVFCEEIR